MRKLALALAVLSTLVLAGLASAHPLGNFTTNRYSRLELSGDRIYVLYVLDLAEIPTYQARDELERLGKRSYAAELADRLSRGIRLRVDGDLRRVTPLRRAIAFPKGVGGLDTTRLEIVYDGGAAPAAGPVSLAYEDSNFPNRIGWREVVVSADGGSRIETSTAPATSVSDELRGYPKDRLASPLDVTSARARYRPGTEQGTPPRLLDPGELSAPARVASQSERGFASLVTKSDLGAGVILVSLLAAMFWGAAHALTPGHGKAIVAAYMVGSRGTARHALFLGGIVTVTHTIGVFTLGGVTLALSEFIVPETLYPWLNLVSALLVVVVGVTVLRLRLLDWLRPWRRSHGSGHGHHHHAGHEHRHPHGADHEHEHGHDHAHAHEHGDDHAHAREHGDDHTHGHLPKPGGGLRGLVATGISGGLLPCPTALVVLLAAISLHRVGYGLVLIVAFSLGLAGAISGIGLLAVGARSVFSRLSFEGRLVRALPAISAVVIIALGLAMTARTLPTLT
jgi:ABC-type nickel/cobalt efflux system permease component RcnA